jgi:hypothetical protein
MFRHYGNRLFNNDLRPVAKVLEHAIRDIESTDEPVPNLSGFLCHDIARSGFSERIAIESIFPPVTPNGPAARLASQVCYRCVGWRDCDSVVMPEPPVSSVDDLSL